MSGILLWIGLTLIVGISHYVGGDITVLVGTILMVIGCVMMLMNR